MKLKNREEQILHFMQEEIKSKGYPPTVREICNALGIKSTSTVHKDLKALETAGYIKKDPSKPRALMIVEEDPAPMDHLKKMPSSSGAYAQETAAFPSEGSQEEVVEVPLVGQIAAGTPILAEEHVEDAFPVPTRFIGTGTHFMLTVRGESMIEAGIMDGDYILVNQQQTANNGDIVVAMIDGFESEATVKTFYKEKDHIRLQPENAQMNPIIVSDVKILGKVKGVFRYF